MTDNEIIKALECCISGYCISDGCPIYDEAEHGSVEKCLSVLAKNALDLINRQKAENSELQLKINELEIELKAMRGVANSYKVEVKNLDKLVIYNASCVARLHNELFSAKSEAYKEFAERLKLHVYTECGITGHKYQVVQVEDIDSTLDELTERKEDEGK